MELQYLHNRIYKLYIYETYIFQYTFLFRTEMKIKIYFNEPHEYLINFITSLQFVKHIFNMEWKCI